MSKHYIMDNGRIEVVEDVREWAAWFESANRSVCDDTINGVRVSTVFLGLDHNWDTAGAPILFETMVFGWVLDLEQRRYCTFQEAEQGHAEMIRRVRFLTNGG